MSSGCGDVLSLEDLKTAKKHQTFEAEVITGRAGGIASGANIDFATNAATGQVQKTMPAILRDIGFRPAAFDFVTGGTIGVNDRDLAVLWPLPSGDGDWYYWEGALPKVIPASSTPLTTGGIADGAWRPVGDLTLRTELGEANGFGLIGRCADVAELRALEPTRNGDYAILESFYAGWSAFVDGPVGGGDFYYDGSDSTSADNGGTIFVTPTGKRWKRLFSDPSTIHTAWFGVHYTVDDNSDLIMAAMVAARKRILQFNAASLARPLVIKKPCIAQTNCGIKFRGDGKDGTVISVQIPAGYEGFGAFHFPGRNGAGAVDAGYAGIEISNFQFLGNYSKCHAWYLQYQFTSQYNHVTIEKFDGAGILIDKSQDSVFNQVDIFDCGRTSGNRNSLIDTFDNTKTLFGPIHIVSTLGSDRANNLRFNDCQWEDNKVCPVFNALQLGPSIAINDVHIEYDAGWNITGTDGGTALRLSEGIVVMNGGQISQYRHIFQSYAELYMTNTRCTPPMNHDSQSGTSGRWVFKNINIQALGSLSTSSYKTYEGCRFFGPTVLNYPDNYTRFDSCTFLGSVSGSTSSAANLGVMFNNCHQMVPMSIVSACENVIISGGTVVGAGDVFGSAGGVYNPAKRSGATTPPTIGVNVQFARTLNKQLTGTAPPASGIFSVGDKLLNTAPAAGGFTGWVCTVAGSPGTWKGFGSIAS